VSWEAAYRALYEQAWRVGADARLDEPTEPKPSG